MNSDAATDAPIDVIYIAGAGHCGSTLLNLCLDQHSKVFGVSEIATLNRKRAGWSGSENALAVPFWAEVDRAMKENGAGSLGEVPFDLSQVRRPQINDAMLKNYAALKATLRVVGKEIIADASKKPNRLDALLDNPQFTVHCIYLVRDGRAIVHAYRRKYGTWAPGWRRLIDTEKAVCRLMAQHGEEGWLTVRYEDMVTDLEDTLRRICGFAGIDFEPAMVAPDTSKFRGLGGNRLRKNPINNILLDEDWRMEMPRSVKFFTTLMVRRFNRKYGYHN
jgi:hypothetical protein